MSKLQKFLQTSRGHLQKCIKESQPLTIVIGNEAADLDSMISAVSFAYLRSAPKTGALLVPAVNIPRKDIRLRPEFDYVLTHARSGVEDLVTLDDLPGPTELLPQNTSWILVDHNEFQGSLGRDYGSRVTGVIDHHVDEKAVPAGADPRIIETAKSCTSLVVLNCKAAWDAARESEDGADKSDDASFAKFAMSSILIDSDNRLPQDPVSTDDSIRRDCEAVAYLEGIIAAQHEELATKPEDSVQYDRTEWFQQVLEQKQSVSKLSLYDILRKDYKEWAEADGKVNLGISSCLASLELLVEKGPGPSDFVKTMAAFAKERDLHVFAIMTVIWPKEGPIKRELLLTVKREFVEVIENFSKISQDELGLERLSFDYDLIPKEPLQTIALWSQNNTSKSRKAVGPLLRKAINDSV